VLQSKNVTVFILDYQWNKAGAA